MGMDVMTWTGSVGNSNDSIGIADPASRGTILMSGKHWAEIVAGSETGMAGWRLIFTSRRTGPKKT